MDTKSETSDLSSISCELADTLRRLRENSGLSQESIAHRAGISTYTYQKFEKGESKPGTPMNPRLHTLFALAGAFEVDIRDLFSFLDES